MSRDLIFEHTNECENIKECDARGSVWSHSLSGPIFGGGHDLYIYDLSKTDNFSYSKLGHTFTHPEYPKGNLRTKFILTGNIYFQVNEIEVFQIQE